MTAHESPSQLDILYLTDSWRWFGKHTGYASLIDYAPSEKKRATEFTCSVPSRIEDLRNRIFSLLHGRAWCCTGRDRRQEALFVESLHSHPTAIGHVLYYERHHPLFRAWEKAPRSLVTTIHHPLDQLRTLHRAATDDLSHLSSALVLYQRDLAFFESHVGKGRVKFVHHGVDTDFFKPVERDYDDGRPPRILFVGVNGRSLEMLHEVVQQVCRERPDVEFHLLVPSRRGDPRNHVYFSLLKRIEQVKWPSNLSDQELLDLYRGSYLLLLPLDYAGACNAHLEALSCGLPIVTNDVGGVRDYGAGSIFPVAGPTDSDGMAQLVLRYLRDKDWHREISAACREFAERELAWPVVHQAHLDAYEILAA